MNSLNPTNSWLKYSLLLILFFIVKATIYLCIMPPFEGWDEYQHLAYMYHLNEHEERPVLNKAFVSRPLLEEIVNTPVPKYMFDQTGRTGSLQYEEYFTKKDPEIIYNKNHRNIRLYQAQHGAIYYKLMLPILNSFPADTSIATKVAWLRAINIIFTGITFASILWLIGKVVPNPHHASILVLLIICQPLLTINGIRITNDALAIMTATWVVIIGLLSSMRSKIPFALAAGILIGISCWTKSTSLVLFPFWCCCIGTALIKREVSFLKSILLIATPIFVAMLVMSSYFKFNLNNYGMLFVMQEALVNKNSNGLSEIIGAIFSSNLIRDIYGLWTMISTWTGGWSFLQVSDIRYPVCVTVTVAMLSWLYWITIKRKINEGPAAIDVSLLCLTLCLGASASIAWHYIQCVIAWGPEGASSNPWYISAFIPFFLFFVYDSGCRWSPKFGFWTATILIAVYLYADIRGVCSMIYHYSGNTTGADAFRKLASIQPDALGIPTLTTAICCFLLLVIYLLYSHVNNYQKLFRKTH